MIFGTRAAQPRGRAYMLNSTMHITLYFGDHVEQVIYTVTYTLISIIPMFVNTTHHITTSYHIISHNKIVTKKMSDQNSFLLRNEFYTTLDFSTCGSHFGQYLTRNSTLSNLMNIRSMVYFPWQAEHIRRIMLLGSISIGNMFDSQTIFEAKKSKTIGAEMIRSRRSTTGIHND